MTNTVDPARTTHTAASAAQVGIWLAMQREPESERFNLPIHLEIRGRVDEDALRLALADVVDRHPALRSGFVSQGGQLRRVTNAGAHVPFRVHGRPQPSSREEALDLAIQAATRPLNVVTAPLLRADLFRYQDGGALLSLTTHHIVCDGWSLEVLVRHIIKAYAARLLGCSPNLGVRPPHMRGPVERTYDQHAVRYWTDLLEGEAAWLAPLPDFAGNGPAPGPSAHGEILLPETLVRLRTLVEHRNVSPAVVLLAAWTLLLHGWSGVHDGMVGMPFYGREHESAQDEIDLYTRVLPIRSRFLFEQSFTAYLDGIRDQVIDSLAHCAVPTDSLRTRLESMTGGSVVPSTVFVHHFENTGVWSIGESTIRVIEHPTETAKYNLTLASIERRDRLRLWVDYDSSVFRSTTIDLLLRQLEALLAAAVESPSSSCHELIAGLAERSPATADAPADQSSASLLDMVLGQAERSPVAAAMKCGQDSWSYRELVDQAVNAAGRLHTHGVQPNDVVALRLPAGPEVIIMTLAVALAGAACLRLGSDEWSKRLLRRSQVGSLIIKDTSAAEPQDAERLRVIDVSEMAASPGSVFDGIPAARVDPRTDFIVRYREKSNGSADRQVFAHSALAAVVGDTGLLSLDPSDVVAQLAPPESDVFIYEVWGALAHGAQLTLLGTPQPLSPADLRSELRRHGVTTLLLTTEQFCNLVDGAPDTLQSLRRICVFGEVLPVRHVRRALKWCGSGVLRYGYTPAAGALVATYSAVDTVPDRAHTMPLGEPGTGVRVDVVIPGTCAPAPLGMPGELLVNGVAVAKARITADASLELVGDTDQPSTGSPAVEYSANGTEPGQVLLAWRDVLGTRPFDLDDNFFDVGGNSLLVIRLQEALRVRTGSAPAVADLFRHTTVRAQAAFFGTHRKDRFSASIHTLAATGAVRADEDIAVIGMACRFACSPDKDAFWENLVAGRDLITTSPLHGSADLPDGARRVPRWGLLADGTGYDARMLGFSAEELSSADPQHGILYECLWAAVEDAALKISNIGPHTSLYVGCDRWNELIDKGTPERPVRADDVVGSSATFLPTRFSYWNDLWSESVLLDTACSTSLVAVHLACVSLQRGDSDYALAGGVSIENPSDGSYVYVPGHIYSKDGVCRPFDRTATGTVGGDGAGAVLLRRLSDALRGNNPVYAVIRGSAVNNDGRNRIGYTAPSIVGQARVIRRALAAAGVTGEEIDFVEPHGTGTRLGDAIEALALSEALGAKGPLVSIGGVKASIGHTNSAAGVAGLIKTVLAIHHSFLPATPNVGEAIEELAENGGRLTLLTEGREWPARDRPRTAGVSSFGVGGTNAHVIVQEFFHDARVRSAKRI